MSTRSVLEVLRPAPRRHPDGSKWPPADSDWLAVDIHYLEHLPYAEWCEEPVQVGRSDGQLLSAEEERRLFRQMHLAWYRAAQLREAWAGGDPGVSFGEFSRLIRRGETLRNELLRAFFRLNLSIAGRFANRRHPFDELASEGQFTLLKAVTRFDPERGFRFSTYAMHAIRRRLLRHMRGRQRERRVARPWIDELAPVDTRRWTAAYEQRVASAVEVVERLLAQLSSRERYVLRSRYGWGQEFEPRTLREIAEELSVSRERVRQLEERALRKLRELAEAVDIELAAF
ncbi:MAG: sigma-70 family RNA polymerase sigma factor [Pirellulaceae bacterium]